MPYIDCHCNIICASSQDKTAVCDISWYKFKPVWMYLMYAGHCSFTKYTVNMMPVARRQTNRLKSDCLRITLFCWEKWYHITVDFKLRLRIVLIYNIPHKGSIFLWAEVGFILTLSWNIDLFCLVYLIWKMSSEQTQSFSVLRSVLFLHILMLNS